MKTMDKIHGMMGHVSANKMKKTMKAVDGLKETKRFKLSPCAACDLTKTKRAPHTKKTGEKSDGSMDERLHSDSKSMPESTRGHKCAAIFVHEGTRHVAVAKLKTKDELHTALKTHLAQTKRNLT